MTEREAFAPRQTYSDGVYSSATWPPNQPMCMHHELSYTLEFPGLMLFALPRRAQRRRCDRGGRLGDRARRAAGRAGRPVRARGLAAHPQLQRRDRRLGRGGVRHRRPRRRRELLPRQRDRVRVAARRWAAHQAAPQRRRAAPRHRSSAAGSTRSRSSASGRWSPRCASTWWTMYGADGLPFNTRFGNGDPIGEDVVQLINEVYDGEHRTRAVAGRRPAARRQHPHGAQPGAVRGTARGARGDGRPGPPGRLLADRRSVTPPHDDRSP